MVNKRPRDLTDIGTPASGDVIPVDDTSEATSVEVKKVAVSEFLARANHTGTQAHTTISDFDAGVQANKLDDLSTPDDNIDLDATTSLHGLMGKADKQKLVNQAFDVQADGTATGDGVTDDQSAIQNALDNNDVVFFPAGTYLLNSKVLITTSNKHIILDSGATLKAGFTGTAIIEINNTSSISNFVIEGDGTFDSDNTTTPAVFITGLVSNFVLRDFEATNCTASDGVIKISSLSGNQPSDFLLENLYVHNVQEGIRTSFANSGIITNCRMRDINGQDTFEILGTNRITLTGNLIIDADTGSAFDILGSTEVNIIGNTYFMSTATSSAFAEIHDHAGSGTISRRVVISGNTMRGGQTRPAIDCDDGVSEVIISNNICSDWDSTFIIVDNSDNVMIHHNILKDHVSGNAVTVTAGSNNTIIENNNFDGEAISDSGTGTIIRFNDNDQTLPHEYGGLEADVSAFDGFVRISGGTTTEIKSNFAATVAPTTTDDANAGYTVGSRWLDTTNDKEYVCLDATASAAVWVETTGAGSSLPVADTTSVVQGSADSTKQMRFEVDGLTTSTTRVLTMPDADLTIVGTTTSQTLTNKTINEPDNTLKVRRAVQIVVFEFSSPISTGDGKFYFHIDPSLGGNDLIDVHAEVITAGTTGTTDIQIHNVTQAVDMLSTKLTIDSTETGSDTAATAAVIDTANDDVAENDLLRIDVDAVSTTPPQGLIVTLGFREP